MSDNPTVKEILIDHIQDAEEINTSKSALDVIWDFLESEDYGGLCGAECGCKYDDLAPLIDCGANILECQAGYEHPCVYVEDDCGCDYKADGCTWCMRLDKPNKPEATDDDK